MSGRRPAARHSYVRIHQPRGWIKGPDLRRHYSSLFLVQLTIALIGVVVTLASAMAFGTRLQRRRKYTFEGGRNWASGDEGVIARMVQIAPPLCSGSVFAVFFLLAYKMMMPKYKRQIFLSSHLFCIVSMISLSVYAVIILMDVLKFPHGSIGILDGILDKEVTVLNNRSGYFHEIVPLRPWLVSTPERRKNLAYSCCGAYSTLINTIMYREESAVNIFIFIFNNNSNNKTTTITITIITITIIKILFQFLRYVHNDSQCKSDPELSKFESPDCIHSESCFYKDAAVYGNRVVLFLIFTMASTISAAVTVWRVIKRDKEEPETDPARDESVRRSEVVASPAVPPPMVISKPTTPTEPSPLNFPQFQ
ncbi:hypothetical protein PRIPAC_90356 [Pristionchus pacificus]|uniref:Uncharacterized protein n=1 Tax=Pristionchus pacificus TaxID=54126 RepID=A0A2A6B3Q0_PRIPA|nr:hypothetical protein PRIPAC_90356 [Pristionchus pacificus]|eukprot:PDM60488.1 hypothetical protein PRIPAC_53466 [Pristionchus pacificus]